jgi:quercetin dioxygenase-like cupin family protein
MSIEPSLFDPGPAPTGTNGARRVTRRAALGGLLAVGLASLAGAAVARRAVAASKRRGFTEIVRRALVPSHALAEGRISQAAWQDELEAMFREISPEEITQSIDLDALLATTHQSPRGATAVPLAVDLTGGPFPGFATKLYVLRAGRSNPPHAHDNMVSLHYVLRGRFRVRHYERVRDEPRAMILRPTLDRILGPGESTSISDERDNVHWHAAKSDGVLLDVMRAGLGDKRTETHLVDPVQAATLEGGLLRAPRIVTVDQALERFG